MSVAGGQQQTFLRLVRALRPHWRRDPALPVRIQTLLSRRREFGSRDRRLYRELIYTTVRYLPWIEPVLETDEPRAAKIVAWLAAETRDTRAYRAEIAGDWPALASLRERANFLRCDPRALLPEWTAAECPALHEPPELEAQLARAPLWLRLQAESADAVEAEFADAGLHWREAEALPNAWRILDEVDVTKSDAYTTGAIEVQDLGSQFVLEAIGVPPAGRWLDACAGAGGKTLQLARLLGPAGTIDAHDIRPAALNELVTRAERAAKANVQLAAIRIRPELPTNAAEIGADDVYDGVLVDAPCSGSGTWRRSPHLKWMTTSATLAERALLQAKLLDQFSALVRPGGHLVYATCSLAPTENAAVVATFLETHPDFAVVPFAHTFGFPPRPLGLTIWPSRHDTDGFFVASLQRRERSSAA